MSVIMESQEGDGIFILEDFSVSPYGEDFSFDSAKDFKIGDNVEFYDYYENPNSSQNYLAWLIIFKDKKGIKYSASQLYFATEETWGNLTQFFKN